MSAIEQLDVEAGRADSPSYVPTDSPSYAGGQWFLAGTLGLMTAACTLAGWFPIEFSVVTVFLFAGPHNWAEARYFLSRMPGRWGKLMHFFAIGIAGTVVLTCLFAALPWIAQWQGWQGEDYEFALATWNTLLVVWVLYLVHLRTRQNPRRDWNWVYPAGLFLLALNWLAPMVWSLALVYLHPLMALWFLDREIAERKPEWQGTYRACLALVPVLVGVLWWRLATRTDLPETQTAVTLAWHSGSGVFGLSPHFLIATHAFLEMLHYGVWLLAIPLIAWREMPWSLEQVPLAKQSSGWRPVVIGLLSCGVMSVLALWVGFGVDYLPTRHIYFTVAMLHVLAEAPFILRLL